MNLIIDPEFEKQKIEIEEQLKKASRDRMQKNLILIAVLLIVSALIFILLSARNNNSSLNPAEVYFASQNFVKERLNIPSSAIFPKYSDTSVSVISLSKNSYEVKAFVDSSNPSGEIKRTSYVCKLRYDLDKSRWHLININFN